MKRASKKRASVPGAHLQTAKQRALVATIVKARNATGLSQREFSKKLGKSNNFMQRLEAGRIPVGALDFIEIAKTAGITPDDFIRRVTS